MLADWIKGARWWIETLTFHIIPGNLSLPSPSGIPHPKDPLGVERWTRRVKLMSFQYFSILFSISLCLGIGWFFCPFWTSRSCPLFLLFLFLTSLPTHAQYRQPGPGPCHCQRRSRLLDIGVLSSPSAEYGEESPAEKISYRYGSLHREKGFAGSNK